MMKVKEGKDSETCSRLYFSLMRGALLMACTKRALAFAFATARLGEAKVERGTIIADILTFGFLWSFVVLM